MPSSIPKAVFIGSSILHSVSGIALMTKPALFVQNVELQPVSPQPAAFPAIRLLGVALQAMAVINFRARNHTKTRHGYEVALLNLLYLTGGAGVLFHRTSQVWLEPLSKKLSVKRMSEHVREVLRLFMVYLLGVVLFGNLVVKRRGRYYLE